MRRRIGMTSAVVLATGVAAAAPSLAAGIGIVVSWSGEQPKAVTLGEVYPPASLTLNSAKTAFETRYAPDETGAWLKSISLDAAFADDETVSVPVRVWPQLAAVFATVHRVRYVACSPADLMAAEVPAGTVPGALKSYFTARALYRLRGPDQCSPNNRRRAAKAWVDRAYELTRLKPYFEFSPEAAAAYSQYDPAYVNRLRQEAIGAALKLVNDEKLKALAAGRSDDAATLNASLLEAMRTQPEVLRAAVERQGLTEGLLTADGALIAHRLEATGAPAEAAPVALEFGPRADPSDAPIG